MKTFIQFLGAIAAGIAGGLVIFGIIMALGTLMFPSARASDAHGVYPAEGWADRSLPDVPNNYIPPDFDSWTFDPRDNVGEVNGGIPIFDRQQSSERLMLLYIIERTGERIAELERRIAELEANYDN